MRPTLLANLLCAILPVAQAFELTGPDANEPLNLTQPIKITWSAGTGQFNEPRARALNLWFTAQGNNGDGYGWEIGTNLSLSAGSYTWNPNNVVDAIQSNDNEISSDKVHVIEARLLDRNGIRAATVPSSEYAVVGYDFITNAGARVGPHGVAVVIATAGMLVAVGSLVF